MADTFEVLLEKKARGRSAFVLSRPWAVRTFKLTKQKLEYFDVDKLKDSVDVRDSICKLIAPEDADNKPFPFELDVGKEKLLLNAPNEQIRKKCMEIFKVAAQDPNWSANIRASVNRVSIQTTASQLQQKAELAAEEKRLNEVRAQQQAIVAASLLQGEAALQKDMQAAAVADKKLKEEQQRQAMELFKKMGAKARFRAARQMGQTVVALDAAATMVQGAWRSRIAKRKMLLQKAEKEKKLMSAAARKIQSRYRTKIAQRRVDAIRAQKLHNTKMLAALRFQLAWRRHHARRVLKMKMEEAVALAIKRQRGIVRLQNCLRTCMALQKFATGQRESPTVMHVTVNAVQGGLSNQSNPGVIVTGLSLKVEKDHPAIIPHVNPNKPSTAVPEDLLKSAQVTSHDRSENVGSNLPSMATASRRLDFVVITLVDRSSGSKDDCLGQAFIRVADVRRKRKNADGSVNLQLPLVSLIVPVDDLNGKVVSRKPATGTITVKVQIAPSAYTMCGWMWKMSEKLLGGNDWKKRWFVLTDGYLVYFNSESALETAKHVINCSKISKIETADTPVKGRIAMKVHYTAEQGNASSFWQLDFDEDAAPAVKKMWERKLFNNAKAVPNPEIESLKKKFDIIKAKASEDERSRIGAASSKKRAGNRKSVF